MSTRLLKEFHAVYPDVPVQTRVQHKSTESFERLLARLERGEIGAVGAVVRDARGFVLLQRHDPRTGWDADTWAIPGGRVEPGEAFEDAVVREVMEETGIKVIVGRPLLYLRQKYNCGNRHAEYPFVFFEATPKNPKATPQPRAKEVLEVRWFHRLPKETFDREVLVPMVQAAAEADEAAPASGNPDETSPL